jgi:hypothetical protein
MSADRRPRFVFSSLHPPAKLVFRCNSADASSYVPEPPPRFHTHNRAPAQPITLNLSRGVLTLSFCDRLLKELADSPRLSPFLHPVSQELSPDYFSIIKHPMDISTLQQRLCFGQVATVAQFKRELDLIWDNCVAYNGEADAFSAVAMDVKRLIDDIWAQSNFPEPSDALKKLAELRRVLDQMADDAARLIKIESRPVIPPVKNVPTPPPKPPGPAPPPVKKPETPPNHQQKKLIAEKLSTTPSHETKKAWDLLRPFMDKVAPDLQTLSLNDIPDDVLTELKRIML